MVLRDPSAIRASRASQDFWAPWAVRDLAALRATKDLRGLRAFRDTRDLGDLVVIRASRVLKAHRAIKALKVLVETLAFKACPAPWAALEELDHQELLDRRVLRVPRASRDQLLNDASFNDRWLEERDGVKCKIFARQDSLHRLFNHHYILSSLCLSCLHFSSSLLPLGLLIELDG
mmetsp:Transcript_11118/g.37777  ORF Transcript_11118/g.37777 Transcript_11118/m.37777 type:complete len:176 (+) Transcript_11118:360-887(+)